MRATWVSASLCCFQFAGLHSYWLPQQSYSAFILTPRPAPCFIFSFAALSRTGSYGSSGGNGSRIVLKKKTSGSRVVSKSSPDGSEDAGKGNYSNVYIRVRCTFFFSIFLVYKVQRYLCVRPVNKTFRRGSCVHTI